MAHGKPTLTPLDALWQAPALLWMLAAGEAVALILALAPGAPESRLEVFGLASLVVQWILVMNLVALYALRGWAEKLRPMSIAYLALVLLLATTFAVMQAIGLFFPGWTNGDQGGGGATARALGIALAVGLLGLAAFHNHWRGRLNAIRAKHAELQALQARIRPHFLFNTLNTGAALVHQRPEEAERLLLDLADLFRAALAGPRKIPLSEELGLVRRYLEIEQLRFGERLQVRWELPRDMPRVTVPALSIQPLVENAIHHGAERMASAEIEIAASTTQHAVVVRITNPVPPAGREPASGHRVGLNASHARIEALTGGRGSVRTEIAGGRFVATVRLPVGDG